MSNENLVSAGDCKERVALDLLKTIRAYSHNTEPKGKPENIVDDTLQLYIKCLLAVKGYSMSDINLNTKIE